MSAGRRAARRVAAAAIAVFGLAGLIVAVFATVVLVLGRVPVEGERGQLALSMAAAGVAVALAFPLHRRLTEFGRRVVLADSGAADDAVRNFASHGSRSIPLDELLLHAAESLRSSWGLASAEVWAVVDGSLLLRVSDPEQRRRRISLGAAETGSIARAGVSGPAWLRVWRPELLSDRGDEPVLRAAPIAHSGELLGMLVVQRATGADSFSAEDERVLGELARQVGQTLYNAKRDSALQASLDEVSRQARELQASRGRLVEAGDTARRQIERDIHDGVQQHLVALAVKVRLIQQLETQNPTKAAELLDSLGEDLGDALQELRDLAHGIYPPLLADKGLAEALASAARRSTLALELEAAGIRRYSRVIEATVYFCCLEALQNAGKYAGKNVPIRVSVREEGRALTFVVSDTGAGFDPRSASKGAGFTNMNDRLGAVGGVLRVESTPGVGTRITGTVPIPPDQREVEHERSR